MSKEEQLRKLWEIHQVEGFDPAAFAVEYTDMNTGEQRKRLPVMIQMAWFRLKYPEGRIAVEVTSAKDSFVAKARVYPSYKDGPECYLAEATASRGPDPAHPTVSPRSGPRPRRWALPCATRALACSLGPWERIFPRTPRMSCRPRRRLLPSLPERKSPAPRNSCGKP